MRAFTLSIAQGLRQVEGNTRYPIPARISNLDELQKAVEFDHVGGFFKDNHRSNKDFISTDCILMDCDNDSSDSPESWMTPDTLADRLPNVEFAAVCSRNHMKDKGTHSARPRFHFYFALSVPVDKAELIRDIKEKLLVVVPEFDAAAKDAARFFFGVEKPIVAKQEGSLCVDEFLTIEGIELPEKDSEKQTASIDADAETDTAKENTTDTEGTIPVGERHGTLLKTAFDALSKYPESKGRGELRHPCVPGQQHGDQ